MSFTEYYPFAKLELGYDVMLPIKKEKCNKPVDDLVEEYFVQLPNGERLQEKHPHPRLSYFLDIGIIWSVHSQKYHGHKWKGKTTAQFRYLIYKTEEIEGSYEKLYGLRWKTEHSLREFQKDWNEGKQEFLKLLKSFGLSPENSDLFLIISADLKQL